MKISKKIIIIIFLGTAVLIGLWSGYSSKTSIEAVIKAMSLSILNGFTLYLITERFGRRKGNG